MSIKLKNFSKHGPANAEPRRCWKFVGDSGSDGVVIAEFAGAIVGSKRKCSSSTISDNPEL